MHAYSYVREEGGTRAVNGPLRAGTSAASPYADLIALQKAALEKLPVYPGRVHRFLDSLPEGMASAPVGSEWIERGFMSTAIDPSQLEPYFTGKPHRFIVQSRTGRSYAPVSGFDQGEVLFAPGARFRIMKRLHDGQGYILHLEEVSS